MQQGPTKTSEQLSQTKNPSTSPHSHHGFLHHDAGLERVRSADSVGSAGSRSASPRSVSDGRRESLEGPDADQLDERLRGLSLGRRAGRRQPAAGQRVSDYEKALTPPTPRQAMGFKVIKRTDSQFDGPQLEDFPNG